MSRKTFIVGKNIKNDNYQHTPVKAEPRTFVDTYHKPTGRIVSRRKFGNDGNIINSLEFYDGDLNKPDKHAHDYNGKKRSHRRKPTKKESNEMKKAERKRRFYTCQKK